MCINIKQLHSENLNLVEHAQQRFPTKCCSIENNHVLKRSNNYGTCISPSYTIKERYNTPYIGPPVVNFTAHWTDPKSDKYTQTKLISFCHFPFAMRDSESSSVTDDNEAGLVLYLKLGNDLKIL